MVHDFANLLGMRLRHRAAEDREILRKDVDQASIDLAIAGDNSVARYLLLIQAEVCRTMGHKHVQFIECTWVQQEVESFASREFAFFMLCLNAFFAATQHRYFL